MTHLLSYLKEPLLPASTSLKIVETINVSTVNDLTYAKIILTVTFVKIICVTRESPIFLTISGNGFKL